jgi:hypothetical protein
MSTGEADLRFRRPRKLEKPRRPLWAMETPLGILTAEIESVVSGAERYTPSVRAERESPVRFRLPAATSVDEKEG